MTLLARQICLNHPGREAVARCVECERYFCRECIADHEGRLICAGCLGRLAQARPAVVRTWPRTAWSLSKSVLAVLCAWVFFYSLGRTLLALPSTFHEDSFFNATWERLQSPSE